MVYEMKQKLKLNGTLIVIFVLLSIFDIFANAGAIIVPVFGGLTETVQEIINETLQVFILGYFALMVKK